MMKPILINNTEFAQKQLQITGEINAFDCLRLAETLSHAHKKLANIRYTLTGAAKKLHLPSLHLQINTQLPVLCQRCLEEMQIDLNLEYDYVISDTAPDEEGEFGDEADWLEATQNMDVCELIEDELLLAMPIATVHATDCAKGKMQSGEKPNPFAVLKGKF
jgi:uncharacterized protein